MSSEPKFLNFVLYHQPSITMASTKIHSLDLPELPADFRIKSALENKEKKSEEARFFCKVIGADAHKVICEADDGIYEFSREDVIDFKSINSKRDLLIVHHKSQFTFHSTLARINRVEHERLRPKETSQPSMNRKHPTKWGY